MSKTLLQKIKTKKNFKQTCDLLTIKIVTSNFILAPEPPSSKHY